MKEQFDYESLQVDYREVLEKKYYEIYINGRKQYDDAISQSEKKLKKLKSDDQVGMWIVGVIIMYVLFLVAHSWYVVGGWGTFLLPPIVFGVIDLIIIGVYSGKVSSVVAENEAKIKELYNRLDSELNAEIAKFNREVKKQSVEYLKDKKIMSIVSPNLYGMYKKVYNQADKGSNKSHIIFNFSLEVTPTDILYTYNSGYSNPLGNFNFDRERMQTFDNSPVKREAMACAMTQEFVTRVRKELTPVGKKIDKDSSPVKFEHKGRKVTFRFSIANPGYVPPVIY